MYETENYDSGPITITVREGNVVIAERTYKNAASALTVFGDGPYWLTRPLHRLKWGPVQSLEERKRVSEQRQRSRMLKKWTGR